MVVYCPPPPTPLSLSLSLSLTHTHTHKHMYECTHTHTHTNSHTHTHTQTRITRKLDINIIKQKYLWSHRKHNTCLQWRRGPHPHLSQTKCLPFTIKALPSAITTIPLAQTCNQNTKLSLILWHTLVIKTQSWVSFSDTHLWSKHKAESNSLTQTSYKNTETKLSLIIWHRLVIKTQRQSWVLFSHTDL